MALLGFIGLTHLPLVPRICISKLGQNWTLVNKLQWNSNQNTKLFIHKNAFENVVCDMAGTLSRERWVNTMRQRQNGRHFADAIFKYIFLNQNVWIPIKISLKFVPKGPINNIPSLVQIMVWRRPGDKPLSEPMMVSLPTHICVTRPQWVKERGDIYSSHDHQYYRVLR